MRFQRQRSGAPTFREYGLGTRIVTIIFAVLIGAFAGALLTAVHQSAVSVGEVPVPWGLVAAVLITAALLVGLRIVFGTRVVPAAAGAGLLAAAAVFAVQTAGGTILVPANPVGYIWTFAPVVLGLAVVLWPRIGAFAHA
jgi:N-acetyl-1-D-myo-inositol-2-amino-2-deoxy-alpha-D-glucopyranoside deacetylase